jgi:hypothetical protein
MKKNKVYNILQEMIGFKMTYLGHENRYSIYEIAYDAKRLIENWNELRSAIISTRCTGYKDVVKYFKGDISDYDTWQQWCRDRNILTLDFWTSGTKFSHEYRYRIDNADYLMDLRSEFMKKLLTPENIEAYDKPVLFLVEKNGWERETWKFGIDLKNNISNIELISKLYNRLSKFKAIDQKVGKTSFFIDDKINEYTDIKWMYKEGYMSSPIYLDGKLKADKIREIIEADDGKIFDMLYKGNIREYLTA